MLSLLKAVVSKETPLSIPSPSSGAPKAPVPAQLLRKRHVKKVKTSVSLATDREEAQPLIFVTIAPPLVFDG
jgi:hypothetical protein